jgi:glycerol-3-phosphate cytidylyltransferase-like family protein
MLIAVAGGYDPITPGHVKNIIEAAKYKREPHWFYRDKLVVILSRNDQLVTKKGYTFYQSVLDRFDIIRNIKGVDEVFLNIDKDTSCAQTLSLLKPKLFCKGGDRTIDNMPASEIEVCHKIGCQIIYDVGRYAGRHSSQLVMEAIKNGSKIRSHSLRSQRSRR